MPQNIYKLSILKLDHRPQRDKRITTHCALVSRTFGASKMYFSGIEDTKLVENIDKITSKWGGDFNVEFCEEPLEFVTKFVENKGIVIHLTMYGYDVTTKVNEIKKIIPYNNVLIIIGGPKVPKEYYELAKFNIAVANQPHSEISALAILLYLLNPNCLSNSFDDGQVKITPSDYKNVVNLK